MSLETLLYVISCSKQMSVCLQIHFASLTQKNCICWLVGMVAEVLLVHRCSVQPCRVGTQNSLLIVLSPTTFETRSQLEEFVSLWSIEE